MPKQHFERPGLPNLCLVCGEPGGLTPREVEFGYVSRRDALLSTMIELLGFFYHRELIYTITAPVCARCASCRRWGKAAIVLMLPGAFAALFAAFAVTSDPVPIVLLPAAVLVACAVAYVALRAKGEPKAVEVNDKRLVVNIPNYGEVTIHDEAPAAHKFTRRARTPPASQQKKKTATAPRLNRAVCGGCGFINFAGASECRKCASPVGTAASA